jgi:hypothetical protein
MSLKFMEDYLGVSFPYSKSVSFPYSVVDRGVEYKGVRHKNVYDLAEVLGVRPYLLEKRIERGLPEAVWHKKSLSNKEVIYEGVVYPTCTALAKAIGIPANILRRRISSGWPQSRWAEKPRKGTKPKKKQKVGYCLADMPEEIQLMAISLAGSLGIGPAGAYAQMLEELV